MNVPLLTFAIIAVAIIFGIAAWFGPKVIRAIYPEERHESMIKAHRVMVIIAIIVGVIGFSSAVLLPLILQQAS